MSVVYSDAARSVIVHYDFHYYCCDNRQYRNISVINQIKGEGVGIKCVSYTFSVQLTFSSLEIKPSVHGIAKKLYFKELVVHCSDNKGNIPELKNG